MRHVASQQLSCKLLPATTRQQLSLLCLDESSTFPYLAYPVAKIGNWRRLRRDEHSKLDQPLCEIAKLD